MQSTESPKTGLDLAEEIRDLLNDNGYADPGTFAKAWTIIKRAIA